MDEEIPSRYFFVVRWPDLDDDDDDDDEDGTLLPNRTAALTYAQCIIRELKDAGGYDDPGSTMIVRNAEGEVIYSIPFSPVRLS
jgi:hypothetical protein